MNGSEVGALNGLPGAQGLDSEEARLASIRKRVRKELALKRVDKALWTQVRAAHGDDREATREAYIETRARWLLASSGEQVAPDLEAPPLRLIGDLKVEEDRTAAALESTDVASAPERQASSESLILVLPGRSSPKPHPGVPLDPGLASRDLASTPADPGVERAAVPLVDRLEGLMQDPRVLAAMRAARIRRPVGPPRALSSRFGWPKAPVAVLDETPLAESAIAEEPRASSRPDSEGAWWPVMLAAAGALVLGACAVVLTLHYRQAATSWSEALEGERALQQGDNERGLKLWGKLAEEGDPIAQLRLGILYQDGRGVAQDQARAAQWYERSAKQDNPDAQFLLAEMYESGLGVPQDAERAVFWYGRAAARFREAAEQGDAAAQLSLAGMYESGNGVPQDYPEALRLYRLAADQGDPSAQLQCGWMYHEGLGTAPDAKEAVRWYRKAAEQGNAEAQVRLGYLYETGTGVRADRAEAERWYQAAASQPGFDARAVLQDLGKQ